MPKHPTYQLKKPSDEIVVALHTALRGMDKWRDALQPAIDQAFQEVIKDGHLSVRFADALEDFGQYCLSMGAEVRAERQRLGIGVSKKLPSAKH